MSKYAPSVWREVSATFLEGSLLRAMIKLEQGKHPDDIAFWLNDRLNAWIETTMGEDCPDRAREELKRLQKKKK